MVYDPITGINHDNSTDEEGDNSLEIKCDAIVGYILEPLKKIFGVDYLTLEQEREIDWLISDAIDGGMADYWSEQNKLAFKERIKRFYDKK